MSIPFAKRLIAKMISGGRPPSSGDVCMDAWRRVGNTTYKFKHLALA